MSSRCAPIGAATASAPRAACLKGLLLVRMVGGEEQRPDRDVTTTLAAEDSDGLSGTRAAAVAACCDHGYAVVGSPLPSATCEQSAPADVTAAFGAQDEPVHFEHAGLRQRRP